MHTRLFLYFAFVLLTLITSSGCKLREKMVYLQESEVVDSSAHVKRYFDPAAYAPTLRPDDLLQIQVGGQDAEALAAFQFYVNENTNGLQGMQSVQVQVKMQRKLAYKQHNPQLQLPILLIPMEISISQCWDLFKWLVLLA